MRDYVEDCLADYRAHRSESELVRRILEAAEKHERRKGQVRGGTKALIQISREFGPDRFIPLRAIKTWAETKSSPTGGLWPCLKNNANVVEQGESPKGFRVRPKYYKAMLSLFSIGAPGDATHSILELTGLGKEIWKGVDPDRYVREERSSWRG